MRVFLSAGVVCMSARRLWVLVVGLAGCAGKPPPPPAPPEPPAVTAEHPVERTLDSFAEFTGYLEAVERQDVRAQVTGYLKEVKFKDGDYVKQGQELFVIDPLPYRAAADSAKAMLAKATADAANAAAQLVAAENDYKRGQSLSGGAIGREELDKRTSSRDSAVASKGAAEAAVSSAKAALVTAEFNLDNCVVRSKVAGTGRVSRTLATPGNLVESGKNVLCTVVSLDPLYAYWVVDETTSLEYRRTILDKKELPDPRDKSAAGLKCFVGLKDEKGFPHAGAVDYAAPEVLRRTGTREIRGVIANPGPQYRLGPGDSIRVKVESGPPKRLVTVPEVAVGSQQRQKYVYVVGKDKEGHEVAEFRPVTVGPVREVGGQRLQVIDAGLTPADTVVVNGLLRVRPGVPVKAEVKPSPVPADAK